MVVEGGLERNILQYQRYDKSNKIYSLYESLINSKGNLLGLELLLKCGRLFGILSLQLNLMDPEFVDDLS
ncbi:MAG: hypothetical protein QG577_584 [Thermodesulfobacteriota bacterium]|nr:hypothetical protein [Thermodesulfobacteriota bacterium]